ncbi:MAG: hypothetical protein C4331_16310 [Meiothermus sp.]
MSLRQVSELPLDIPAGTVAKGYVNPELSVPLSLPFTVVRGAQPGPRLLVTAGARVHPGQDTGYITDPFGKVLQPVVAPIAGVVLFAVTSLAINRGDPLYGIGA